MIILAFALGTYLILCGIDRILRTIKGEVEDAFHEEDDPTMWKSSSTTHFAPEESGHNPAKSGHTN